MNRISDVHVHVGSTDTIGKSISFDEITKFRDRYRINKLMLMSFEIGYDYMNKKIANYVRENKNVYGLYWLTPKNITSGYFNLQNTKEAFVGIKYHGSYSGLPISDPVFETNLQILSDRKGILLVHCGMYKDGSIESNTSFHHAITVAKQYPKIKTILAHMGGNNTSVTKEVIKETKGIDNIFLDTSGSTTPFRIEYAVKHLGASQIIFGSDFPFCSFNSVYHCLLDTDLSESIKHKILAENFERLVQ